MKKFGFTLAEILITLGIVGVVAAITLPSLMSNTADAQIGPKLAKAVSMFEQGTEALLNEQSVDAISDVYSSAADFGNALQEHLKISPYTYGETPTGGSTGGPILTGSAYTAKDGIVYIISYDAAVGAGNRPHQQTRGDVFIDINGTASPNAWATDIFAFKLYNDGTLVPYGASSDATNAWTTTCAKEATPTKAEYCAGHIFENNLKVSYK